VCAIKGNSVFTEKKTKPRRDDVYVSLIWQKGFPKEKEDFVRKKKRGEYRGRAVKKRENFLYNNLMYRAGHAN